MESTQPPVMPQNREGSPSLVMSLSVAKSGWPMMPTRYPWSRSTFPMRATPMKGESI